MLRVNKRDVLAEGETPRARRQGRDAEGELHVNERAVLAEGETPRAFLVHE